jgi:superkiller protein 3
MYIYPKQGKQDLKQAEKLLSEALNCYPQEGEVLYTAGLLASQKKEFAKMTTLLNDAIKFSPKFKAQAETLKAYTFQQTFIAANEYLDKAAKATKEEVKLYYSCIIMDSTATGPYKNLGYAFFNLGQKDSSKVYDEKIYKMAPDTARWAYAHAVNLVNSNRYGEAITVLETVVKLDSLHWDAWGLLGQLYEAENRLPEFVAVYQKLSRQFPDSAEFLGQLALYELRRALNAGTEVSSAVRNGYYRAADSLYARYLAENPADSSAWYNRGLALVSLKDYAQAATVLEETTKKFVGYADAWEGLSGAYAQMGKADKAKEAFAQAKQLRGEK